MYPAITYGRFARRAVEYWLGRRRPLWMSWFVNSECQIRCGGCFFFSRNFSKGEPLTSEERFAALDQIVAIKQPFLTLLGGEPFKCPDLFPLARRAQEGGITLEVTTNGLDLGPADLDQIEGLFFKFWVSIDGEREAHERNRGPGTWDRAMDSLRGVLARARWTKVGASVVLNRYNSATMVDFLRSLRDLGVYQICLKDNLIPELRVDEDELRRVIDGVLTLKQETPAFIQQEEEFLLDLPALRSDAKAGCRLSTHLHISLLPDGTVSACVSYPVAIGNLREQTLAEILAPGPAERYAGADECPGCTRNDYFLFERFLKRPWNVLNPRQAAKLIYS